MRLSGHGVAVELPSGWEGRIRARRAAEPAAPFAGPAPLLAPSERRLATVHAASFPLPAEDGEFGTEATSEMPPGGVFASLVEYLPGGGLIPGRGLFAATVPPWPLRRGELRAETLLRQLPGQQGFQGFFTARGRPFCLYVVVGGRELQRRLAELNAVLATVSIL